MQQKFSKMTNLLKLAKISKIYKNRLAIFAELIYTIIIIRASETKHVSIGGKSLMKTFKKLVSILMAALLLLALSSCDLIEDAATTPIVGTVTDENGVETEVNGIKANEIRIGILFADDYEKEGTQSNVQWSAINTMMGTYGIAGTIPKNKIDVTNTQKIEDSIISCVKESGCNVVLSTDPAFTEAMLKFSKDPDYKNIAFTCLDNTGKYESTENFNCFYPAYEEAYALAGIAAASKGGANVTLTDDNALYADAFALGAKAVNPAAKVINGEKLDTYGTVVTNWHVYYMTLIEKLTLGTFDDMGNYFEGVKTGFCDFTASEDYTSDEAEDKMSDARLALNEGKWDLAKAETIKF